MDLDAIVVLEMIALLITGAMVLAGVIWGVANIKTEGVANRIVTSALTEKIGVLSEAIDKIDVKVDSHEQRISHIEGANGHNAVEQRSM